MNKSYQYLDIDINKKIYRRLNAVQGDTKSRYILVSLYNNSIAFDLSNCSVKVFGVKSDKKIFFNYANIIDASKGQFEIELTSQALAVNGELQIQILVLGSNQERLTTCTFFIDVDRTIVDDNAIQSENEFTALTKGLADLAEYDIYKNNVLKHDENLIKHENKINEVSSQLAQIAINVKDFGAKGDGTTDDTISIKNAIEFARTSNTNKVYFPKGVYCVSDTIQIHPGLHLLGAGRNRKTEDSSALKRIKDITLLQAKGESILNSNSYNHIDDFIIENMKLITNDYIGTPLVDLTNVGSFRILNCFFWGQGNQLLLWEAFDSRIENTDFEWGGNEGKKLPVIELRSTNGDNPNNPSYEYTNQIHFTGCRFESYPGYAIKTTGSNTNEIFITNCKFESIRNTVGHLHFNSCGTLLINNTQVCLSGYETDHSILFNNVHNSNVYINFEVSGRRKYSIEPIRIEGNKSSGNVFSFMTGEVSQSMLENEINCLISTDLNTTQFNCNNVDMIIESLSVSSFKLYPLDKILKYKDVARLELEASTDETSIKLSQKNHIGYWDIGRLRNNGEFVFIRYDGSKEFVNFLFAPNGDITSYNNHFFKSGIHLAKTNVAPWTDGNGTMYLDKTNTIPTFANAINGKYRHISYAGAVPTEGNWERGTIIYNTNPAIGQPIGWVCTETGTPGIWRKFGTIEQI